VSKERKAIAVIKYIRTHHGSLQIKIFSAEKAGEVGAGNVEHNCPTPHQGAKFQTSSNKYKTKGRKSKVPEEQPTLHMHFFHCLRLPFLDHHLH
jgi:hypothetical protein